MEFLKTLVIIIRLILNVYALIIVARVFVSLFVSSQNSFTAFVYRITEPVLKLFRKITPQNERGMDWSALTALIAFLIVSILLISAEIALTR